MEKVVITGACHDCGGRCVHKVHVKDGVIIRIETDDGEEPQLRSCLKGRAYRQRVYSPDRLKYPMKRVGRRGEGHFARISWAEALGMVAAELQRVKRTYGSQSILCVTGTGAQGHLHNHLAVQRLLNLFGGCTIKWGSASAEGARFASRVSYGDVDTAHTRDDLLNSRLIIMWGWNPVVTIQGTNTGYYLVKAKEAGARIITVDPRFTDSAAVLADQWIPIRPGTDAAMMAAMAYVMITENLLDRIFLDKYTVGFDLFKDYVLGVEDGVTRTPAWAEMITGVPAKTISDLAREYATTRPAALMPGFGPGRTAYGEQFHRAAITLAAMTGSIGINGGNPAGLGLMTTTHLLPEGENPAEPGIPSLGTRLDPDLKSRYRIHGSKIWDALLEDNADGHPHKVKLLYVTGSNCLNSFLNINKGVEALPKMEFIVVQEQFMTPTAKFADVLLPASTHLERNDIFRPWFPTLYYIYANQVIEPWYESKSDFEIACELAHHLGIGHYSDKTEEEWLRSMAEKYQQTHGHIADYEEFKRKGVYQVPLQEPVVAFRSQIEDPENNPFPTPSGKIEIYSQQLADLNIDDIPPIPKYMAPWEGPDDPLAEEYPLQLITAHPRRRANSAFDNLPWLKETEVHGVTINTADAQSRGIADGEMVKVFNRRGELVLPASVTERIMPGIVNIGQGAWFSPDERGRDRGGSANVLTRDTHSPAGVFPYNTGLVQVAKI